MKWLNFIFSHSIFVSLCSTALCFQTFVLFNQSGPLYLYLLIFFSTLASYNFYWLLSRWKFRNAGLKEFVFSAWTNILVMIIAALGLIFCFFQNLNLWPALLVSVMLTLLYSVPLWPLKLPAFLKNLGLVKTVLLAAAWAYTTVFIPAAAMQASVNAAWMIFVPRFLFMLMLCIMFDARDANVDRIRSLKSLATDFRPSTVRLVVFTTFAMYMLSGVLFRVIFNDIQQVVAFLLTGAACIWVYLKSLNEKRYLFYYFVVDGLMLFSAITTYLASII